MRDISVWLLVLLALWCHIIIDENHRNDMHRLYQRGQLYIDIVVWTCSLLLPIEIVYIFQLPGWIILLVALVNSIIRGFIDFRYMYGKIDQRRMQLIHVAQVSITYAFILSVVPTVWSSSTI